VEARDNIKGFSWLTYYGAKFSTSRRYGVFMDAALQVLPADYWRYFLVANAPESDHVDFTWELFAAQVNKDLADTFGNLVNRVLTLTRRTFGAVVPAGGIPGDAEAHLADQVGRQLTADEACLSDLRLRAAARHLKALWSLGNVYVERKAPWREVRNSEAAAATTLRTALNLIYLLGLVSEPVIPSTATTVQRLFHGVDHRVRWPTERAVRSLDLLPPGSGFRTPPPLFRKITAEDVAAWRKRFGTPEL